MLRETLRWVIVLILVALAIAVEVLHVRSRWHWPLLFAAALLCLIQSGHH